MSLPTTLLGLKPLRLTIGVIAASGLSFLGLAVYAQPTTDTVNIIPNTASANFRNTPGGPLQSLRSNTVTVPVAGQRLEIIKVGDRGAAEPGDTVIYRVQVRNTGGSTVTDLVVTDTLPLGLRYVTNSAKASLSTAGSPPTPVNLSGVTVNGQVVSFRYPNPGLSPQQTLTIAYGALLTPDALRGSGRNQAVARGRNPAGGEVVSNQATHLLRIRQGILSDCGTIVGRVFVDKNFDGEQQPGEPGVPNAVVFMDDGNRITTDAEGLFSLPYAIAGVRTGTLDLTSLPGYTLAPNLYRIENNAPSRMVRLAPGGLARMNFAVTPSFREGQR